MSMPKLPTDSGYTKLDKFLRQYRIKELVSAIGKYRQFKHLKIAIGVSL